MQVTSLKIMLLTNLYHKLVPHVQVPVVIYP